MIVAITGGTGFIGRHLVARHLARGDQVRYLTRTPPAVPIAGATAIVGDLAATNSPALERFARGADVLYHCAAELRNDAVMQTTNVSGTARLIEATGGEIGRWVQLSSTGVYGRRLAMDIDEESAENPANAYEQSKAAADQLLHRAAIAQRLQYVVLRPSNVYATDMPNRSLFQLIGMIDRGLFFFIGRPGSMANYVHVDNVVDALMLAATAALPGNGRTYIVSDHAKLEEFVGIVAAALAKSPPHLRLPETLVRAISQLGSSLPGFPLTPSRVDALTSRHIYRTERIRAELKFENSVSMQSGISELARYWKGRPADA